MSEIRVPWRFRTLRSTASGEAATGETFLKLVKLENNSADVSRDCTFVLPPPKPFRAEPQRKWTTTALGFEQSVGNHSILVFMHSSTAPSPRLRLVSCLLFFYRQALSPLLFCFVPVLQACSKCFLVRISLILRILTKRITIFRFGTILVRC